MVFVQRKWGGPAPASTVGGRKQAPSCCLRSRWRTRRHTLLQIQEGLCEGDLLSAVTTLWRAFRGPLGHALAGLVADMAQDAALASSIRRDVMVPRRRSMRQAIERARARGEASDNMDVELLLDMLTESLLFSNPLRSCVDEPQGHGADCRLHRAVDKAARSAQPVNRGAPLVSSVSDPRSNSVSARLQPVQACPERL